MQTRHRASTSMYSLTFCVRFLLPERHQWKARIPDCRSNVENAPVGAQSPTGRPRPIAVCGARFWGRPPRRPPVAASLEVGFALCCHSNATRAPIANPPNSAQLGGSLYHAPKLHPGPCSSVGVRPRTDRHTDARDHNTF